MFSKTLTRFLFIAGLAMHSAAQAPVTSKSVEYNDNGQF